MGVTVNIGISTNFLLAKIAGDFQKPDQVHTLFPDEIERNMWPLPVSELFGVGKVTETKLHRWAIYTIGDLAKSDESFIYSNLKTPGLILQKYARGGDLEPYIYTPVAKGYGNSLTAPQDVVTEAYVKHLLLSLAETIGARLRENNVTVRVVCVHITIFEFQYFHKQRQLFTATNVTEEIYRSACEIFHDLWDGRTPIRQLGIHITQVQTDAGRQYNLFDFKNLTVWRSWTGHRSDQEEMRRRFYISRMLYWQQSFSYGRRTG